MLVKRIKNYILLILIIVILLCAAGCGKVAGNTIVTSETDTTPVTSSTLPVVSTIPGHSITVQDAKILLDSGSNAAIFIDVRTQADYDTLHIPGAVLIPVEELPGKLSEVPTDKQIIVYAQCR